MFNFGKDHFKGGSGIYFGFVAEHAAVFLHNASGNRKSQAGSALFGREKRVKQALLDFRWYALTIILHRDDGG